MAIVPHGRGVGVLVEVKDGVALGCGVKVFVGVSVSVWEGLEEGVVETFTSSGGEIVALSCSFEFEFPQDVRRKRIKRLVRIRCIIPSPFEGLRLPENRMDLLIIDDRKNGEKK
jgi:hypothetical protein